MYPLRIWISLICEIGINKYVLNGKNNVFPIIEVCPFLDCKAVHKLYRHGFRKRYAVAGRDVFSLVICRIRCPICGRVLTILPSFLLERFITVLDSMIEILAHKFKQNLNLVSRQLVAFYTRRFLRNLNHIEIFIRSLGCRDSLPTNPVEKAIRFIEMIRTTGKETFTTRFFAHFNKSIMAV